ncbi:MAG: C10 family peptidase, partial [Muribaculaceae bacterium]|nr:C10 family peptidase [Muribaculaceae bacterium]
MVKKLIFSALALAYVAGVNAVTLTPEEALARAGKAAASPTRGVGSSVSPKLSFTQMTKEGAPAVYVFNNDEGGFMVLSADDVAYPVLGYSDAGQLTGEDVAMNPALEWWLGEYARQIEYAASHEVPSKAKSFVMPSTRASYEAITPMVKTKWDQGTPYNNQCPMYGTYRTYTGCVATAMAQVMNYWKYPEVGQGQIGYEASSIGKRLSLNFSKKKFDWDNMLPAYYGNYTKAQEDAVAYLMKACGYAVKMDYSPESSGALGMNIANGLQKYFNYDPNMLYTLRDYYTTTQWTDLIYDNLKNVGPVLYGGGSFLGGGHSFVCDGYDGNGMFHFNWGWSGMSDGYFSLDALNPDALGTGGGAGGGYNFSQDAVLGIQPPTGKPVEVRREYITQAGSLGAYIKPIEKTMLHFSLWGEMEPMWVNYNPTTLKVYFGAIFEPQGTTPGGVKKISACDVQFTIEPGYGTAPNYFDPKVDLLKAGLSDGVYKVTIATFNGEGEDAEWTPVRVTYPYCDFVTLKKNGDNFEILVDDIPTLEIEDAGIDGHFYNGCPITVNAKVVNNFDIELTTGLAPAFVYDNVVCFLGESIMVTVPPHSSVEKEWTTIV